MYPICKEGVVLCPRLLSYAHIRFGKYRLCPGNFAIIPAVIDIHPDLAQAILGVCVQSDLIGVIGSGLLSQSTLDLSPSSKLTNFAKTSRP